MQIEMNERNSTFTMHLALPVTATNILIEFETVNLSRPI